MKKLSICIASAILTLSTGLSAFAATSGSCGENLSYSLSGNTLTITGSGDMYNTPYDAMTYYNWIDAWGLETIKTVVFQEGITSIGAYAFESQGGITEVVIPDGVKSIEMGAFRFTSISTVTIPSSVTEIAMGAFYDCPLQTVNYGGSEEQWNAISISPDYNDDLLNANIICSGSSSSASSDGISVTLNGEYISFDQAPVIINDRTMVPLRAIFEALGAEVRWNGEKQTILGHNTETNTTVLLEVGETTMARQQNGGDIHLITLDSAPVIVNDRTLVPARAIAEAFDCNVEWDGSSQTVVITKR